MKNNYFIVLFLLTPLFTQAQRLFVPGSSIGASNNAFVGIGTADPNSLFSIRSYTWNSTNGIQITSSGAHFSIRPRNGSDWDWELIQSGNFGNLFIGRDNRYTKFRGYIDLIESDNSVKIRLNKSGHSYFNGGNVGIGVTNPAHKLTVDGTISASEVKVSATPNSDYVFESDYPLLPLSEVESHIKKQKHLPGIPSAEEFSENGVGLGEMDDMLLRKVEELTLYAIEQEKEISQLKEKNGELQADYQSLIERIEKLENK